MVTLENKTRMMKVYNLDHPSFRTKQWGAKRTVITVFEEHRDGRRLPRQVRRNLPGSITLRAGEKRSGLPDQIQAVPSIRKAIKNKVLGCTKDEAKPAAPTKSSEAPTPAPAKTKSRKANS